VSSLHNPAQTRFLRPETRRGKAVTQSERVNLNHCHRALRAYAVLHRLLHRALHSHFRTNP